MRKCRTKFNEDCHVNCRRTRCHNYYMNTLSMYSFCFPTFFALAIKCNGPTNDHVMGRRGEIVYPAFHHTHIHTHKCVQTCLAKRNGSSIKTLHYERKQKELSPDLTTYNICLLHIFPISLCLVFFSAQTFANFLAKCYLSVRLRAKNARELRVVNYNAVSIKMFN